MAPISAVADVDNLPHLLRGAFNEEELAYLNGHPKFQKALAKIITTDDFESVCVVGEDLLAARQKLQSPPS